MKNNPVKNDVREAFVVSNRWEKKMPCPKCRTCDYSNSPPKNLVGVASLFGQNIKTGQYLYGCHTCSWEGTKG